MISHENMADCHLHAGKLESMHQSEDADLGESTDRHFVTF